MNNFDLHEEARQLADAKTAYELARELVGHKSEISRLKQAWADEIEAVKAHRNKIKAEAVREAFESAKIPSGAKAGCIGEFSVHVENGGVCPECYNGHYDDEIDVECEICRGKSVGGLYDVSHDIPWTTQKEIFKAFCKYAAQDYANRLERGEA